MKIENTETNLKSPNKVTVGFKCHPEIKLTLSNEAKQLDITLSEYVETLILNKREENKAVNEIENDEIVQHQKTINELKHRIAFYENNLLADLYNANKNETICYINSKNETVKIKINEITDVYTVLVNSFKNK
ncbi:MAG TPA: hypothetical protein VF411_03370 [Bacteroidia bacterium]